MLEQLINFGYFSFPNCRGFGGAVSTSFSYACAFAAVKTYVDIHAHVGLYGAFWIYSGVSVAGLFFVCCVVPETKGVELEEMEHHSIVQTTALNPTSHTPPNTTPAPSSASSNLVCTTQNKSQIIPPTKDNYYPPPLQTPPGAKLSSPRPQLHLNLKLNNFVHHNSFPDHPQPTECMPLQYRQSGRLMMMPHLGPAQSMPYEVMHRENLEDDYCHAPPNLGYSNRYSVEPYYYRRTPLQHPSSLPPYHHDLMPEVPLLYSERNSLHVPPQMEQLYYSEEESDYGILPYSTRLTTGPFRPKRGTVV